MRSFIKSNNPNNTTGGVKASSPAPTSQTYAYQVPVSVCKHCFQAVRVGDYTIYATASMDLEVRPRPDLGVYLASYSWSRLFEAPEVIGKPEGFGSVPRAANYPAIIVDWTDGAMLNYPTLRWLVDGIITNIKNGKKVEVGCVGGHGRTGTLIACVLGRIEQVDARRAITSLRKRYCDEAVETTSQIRGIADFLNSPYPYGVEPSKKPVTTYFYGKDNDKDKVKDDKDEVDSETNEQKKIYHQGTD